MDSLREKWDARYRASNKTPEPAEVLAHNLHLLPKTGTALEIACGLGGNALQLAACGLLTTAWDLSPVAIEGLKQEAARRGLAVQAEAHDVMAAPPPPDRFDVIVVSRFLERDLAPALVAALRPSGLLFYQSFTRARVDDSGPQDEAFRLARNELLQLFRGLSLVVYREEDRIGDLSQGLRNTALLIGQKPASISQKV